MKSGDESTFVEQVISKIVRSNFEDTFYANDKIIVYSAGAVTQVLLENIQRVESILAICDKRANNNTLLFDLYPVMTIEEALSKFGQFKISISTLKYYDEIKRELSLIVPEKDILDYVNWETRMFYNCNLADYKKWLLKNETVLNQIYDNLENDISKRSFEYALIGQENVPEEEWEEVTLNSDSCLANYFNSGAFEITDEEVFVDIGAYNGDTIDAFIKYTDNKYKKILAFEPDEDIFRELDAMVTDIGEKRIKIYKKGISNFTGEIGFTTTYNKFLSRPDAESKNKIDVVAIDDIEDEITFIKICVKGTDNIINILEGAKETFQNVPPKLAIIVSPIEEDIIEIPKKLLQINPDYKISFRITSYNQANDTRNSFCYYATV